MIDYQKYLNSRSELSQDKIRKRSNLRLLSYIKSEHSLQPAIKNKSNNQFQVSASQKKSKYKELMKLLRHPSLHHSIQQEQPHKLHYRIEKQLNNRKKCHKSQLETDNVDKLSTFFIKKIINLQNNPSANQSKTRTDVSEIKDRRMELNLFKIQKKHAINRIMTKFSKDYSSKQLLIIQQPSITYKNSICVDFKQNQSIKLQATIKPLTKTLQKLNKFKETLLPKQRKVKKDYPQICKLSSSLNLTNGMITGWTIHKE